MIITVNRNNSNCYYPSTYILVPVYYFDALNMNLNEKQVWA